MAMPGWFAFLTALLAATLGGIRPADARTDSVEEWLDDRVAPYVAATLAEHPRFRDVTVRIVVLGGDTPLARVDELSLRLRDRLHARVIDVPTVRVSWQPDRSTGRQRHPQTGDDCSADEVQYLIGLELRQDGGDTVHASVRALDTVENRWVPGFGKEWRGRLDRGQRRAFSRSTVDQQFLGDRQVPYDRTETDLMAAHLAHDLRCRLMRGVSGEYVVALDGDRGGADEFSGVMELVGNNVAGVSSLQFVVDGAQANAVFESRAHLVDGDLRQYWITITPTGSDADLQPISASVYVRVPEVFMNASIASSADDGVAMAGGAVLDSLRLVRLEANRSCPGRETRYRQRAYGDTRSDCLGLEVTTTQDAVVFVLNHQQNNGLVRLAGDGCEFRTAARIARAHESITVPLPTDLIRDGWLPAERWQLDPDADTYYAIAISDSEAARAIASHLDKLPRRCSDSVRLGYEGHALESWLRALSASVARWQPHVDWDAIRIKNVY